MTMDFCHNLPLRNIGDLLTVRVNVDTASTVEADGAPHAVCRLLVT